LNESTGAQEWNASTTGGTLSSPAFAYGRIYVGAGNYLLAFNASTGARLWNFTEGAGALSEVDSSPAVADGKVFFGTGDSVFALNAYTGAHLWNYSEEIAFLSSPAVAEGMVFIGNRNGRLYAFGQGPLFWAGDLLDELNVSETCGSEINATSLSFGSLVPGQTSTQQPLLLTNIGSIKTADITLEGTDWIASPAINFTANYTRWNTTNGFAYADGTSASNSPASLQFNLTNNQSNAIYYRIQIPLAQATATYTQNITLTTLC